MSIPEEIRAVPRPKNSIVHAYGKNKDHYSVIARAGCVWKNGKAYPVNGATIGHIIDGVYVPIEKPAAEPVSFSPVTLKNWGSAQLCFDQISTLKEELLSFYTPEDAEKILAIAILRVVNPGIKDYELKEEYDSSFLSELMPGVALSRNTVCTFVKNLGKAYDRIRSFMKLRAEKVGIDHHLLVDGTLKSDESTVNSLSDFSRKARLKGSRDISVLYAFDYEKMEPVCSQCFPGNMLDLTAYDAFVKDNGIKQGILVGDKGFPEKSIEELLKEAPNLHYLNPLRRSAKIAKDHQMYSFEGVIEGKKGFLGQAEPIQYKKARLARMDKWLYSFRDPKRAAREEEDWLRRHQGKDYNSEEYQKKKDLFGTVVFESDLNLSAEEAWEIYSYRWEIEIVMRFYKEALCFDETRAHNDYSVLGSELINFISTVITFRLIRLFTETKLFDDMTYKAIMRVLSKANKARTGNGEWELLKMNPSQITILQTLGLLPKPEEQPKRKRGRPRKQPL